jgi:hypothetical protein
MLWLERSDGVAPLRLFISEQSARNFARIAMNSWSAGRLVRNAAFIAALALAVAAISGQATAANVTSINSGRTDLAVFLIEGTIVGGETLVLEGLVSKLPSNKPVAVILQSSGGSLGEAMKLGRFFHQARIPTFVLGYGGGCVSACSMAFLGGRDMDGRPSRTKMSGGSLGFHQFHRTRDAADADRKFTKAEIEQEVIRTRATASQIIQYLSDIGEGMSILHLMLKAPAADVNFLSNEDAITYGIHVMDERTEQMIDSTSIRARIEAR